MVRAGFTVEGSGLKLQRFRVYPSLSLPPPKNRQGLGGVTRGGIPLGGGGGRLRAFLPHICPIQPKDPTLQNPVKEVRDHTKAP